MPSLEHVIEHPTLKYALRGKSCTTSVQFRNLKYASIPARYRDSIPNEKLRAGANGVFDATKFGPSCPQKRGAQAWDLTLFGDVTLPCEQGQGESEEMDEFECLHVNVTIPNPGLDAGGDNQKGLPVFVWVHGGGLSVGSNTWPQYDLQKFVDRGVEIGRPVVGVAMNYRLGLFGFMAKEELEVPGNMGYKDQVLAFRWIKKHIAGFGGDPNNITAAGNSAGGISLSTLLCADVSNEGLFEKVVIMSGETTLRKPRNKWWHEQVYADQANILGIQATDTEGLRTKLLDTRDEDLAQQLPFAAHYCGYVDGEWLKKDVTPDVLSSPQHIAHKPQWCRDFVIGDTTHDGTILQARILDLPHALDRLKLACSKYLSEPETQQLLSAYMLDSNLAPKQERDMLLRLASELRFYDPTRRAYRGWTSTQPPRSASRYHFHVSNPFEGAYTGLASHELDVAYLLQNFNDQLDKRNQDIARAMADHFINFMHGNAWATDGKLVVFDGAGAQEVDGERYDEMYRQGRGTVLESIEARKLWKVAEMWQGVRSEDEEKNLVARL
jgi:carboxylesterase type B